MKLRFVLLTLAVLISSTAFGSVELSVGNRDWTETRTVDSDYLFAGETLDFKGRTRDLFFFCRTLIFSGETALAVNGFARDLRIAGVVSNGIRAAGRELDIDGTVNGTSFLAGESVTLGTQSRISGDTFIGARKINLLGKHDGNLRAGAAEIVIQNKIEGDVTVYAGQLRIPEQGEIKGNLTYHSDQAISPEEAARVTGTIRFEEKKEGFFGKPIKDRMMESSIWFSLLFRISFLVFGLLLLIFPMNRVLDRKFTGNEILSHSLWGLIPIFVYPSAFVVSLLLVITIPVAVCLLLSFLPVLFVTKTVGLTLIGGYLTNRFQFGFSNRYLFFLMAAIPYSLLSLIPFFGALLLIFVTSIGAGLIVFRLFNRQTTDERGRQDVNK